MILLQSSQEAIARALLVQNSDYEQGDGMQMMLDIDFADTKGNTPLHLAAEAGDIEMVGVSVPPPSPCCPQELSPSSPFVIPMRVS